MEVPKPITMIIKGVVIAIVAFMLYAGVCSTAYRFRHPEQTETQVLLNMPDALRWQ